MKRIQPADDASDWDARAAEALEIARLMPPEKAVDPKKGWHVARRRRHRRAFPCEA